MLKVYGLLFISLFSISLSAETLPIKSEIPNHAAILLYHHVDTNTPATTTISPDLFSQHLAYLADNQFQVWTLGKIVSYLTLKKPIPDKVVAITFDDGYQSVYENAYPMIKRYEWPFTIFVSTNAIDQGYSHQASWEQLRTMADNGAAIGNHSATHTHFLKRYDGEGLAKWQQRATSDIMKAERRIIEEIGHSEQLFAYPYGEYNRELTALVHQMGFTGFGQQSGPVGELSNFLTIPSFPFSGRFTNLDDFALKLMTLPFPLTAVIGPDTPLDHAISKPELTLKWQAAVPDFAALRCFGSGQGNLAVKLTTNHQAVIIPSKDIPLGRSRYNCTARIIDDAKAERFYWYSKPWVRLNTNNQWILD